MAPSNHLPKLRIALLFGAALMPALSLAQSVQAPPLPKAPPEIMSKEARDPKACAQQGLTVGQDNKPQSADTTGKSLSEQLDTNSDGKKASIVSASSIRHGGMLAKRAATWPRDHF
jgi:hypothetical protein